MVLEREQNLTKLYDFKLPSRKLTNHSFSYSIWLETLDETVAQKIEKLFEDEIPSVEEIKAIEKEHVPSKEIWNVICELKLRRFALKDELGET
mmetsp:Transcript_12306/g.22375  ORF Transcript_12306/g.22375 Transcript_12306/m.22375 type:complete len:93 (-) Transcript_12306:41-319(-)